MQHSQNMNNCMYNPIYTKFNEDFNRQIYFSYDIQYPSFFNITGSFFSTNPQFLKNINSTIKSDVVTFKDGLFEEQENFNNTANQNGMDKRKYRVVSNYATTFNKNHILSVILTLMGFDSSSGPLYNELNNYNIDLLTGNTIAIKDIFNTNVNYIKLITNYVNYKIAQDKDLYYEDVEIYIPGDQSFYITDDGIVIYFGLDEIAPAEFGIPKFKMNFEKFAPYINPRFYCSPRSLGINSRMIRNSKNRNVF
ncbi:MAG: DUF3298 domain-containing protein [Romboutsia sp.]|uniref:DUF3298 and DUF4163 domain-containing protein n=1 Tax=Romboutsia sp. TaxID=1965302 RepID=UPI003F2EEEC6